MPNPTPDRLAAIRERHAAATDGPWWFDESEDCWRLHGGMSMQILKAAKQGTPYAEYWPDKADAAFIVGAWEDMRILLAEVDVLRAQVDLLSLYVQAPTREVIDKLVGQLREQAGGEPRG